MKTKRFLLRAVFTGLILLLPVAKAEAEPYVDLETVDIIAPAGTTYDVYGVISNLGTSTIRVGVPSVSLDIDAGFTGIDVDISPFFDNPGIDPKYDAFVIGAGGDTGRIKLFSLIFDPSAVQNFPVFGLFFVIDNQNAFSNAKIFIVSATEPIPEPTTMILLGTGLAGGWATLKRRRRKEAVE